MKDLMTYLDYNATAPLRTSVIEKMTAALKIIGNASSVHRFGRIARQHVNEAREALAAFINAEAQNIIFTGSGTESNNHALRSVKADVILASAIEHDSVLKAHPNTILIPVDANGIIQLDDLEKLLIQHTSKKIIIAVMLANNETGVIQPVKAVTAIAKKYGAMVLCDAVQALGKINVDFKDLDCDMMTLSAHKVGGPQGVAALVVKDSTPLSALIQGGGQERNLRAGTHNVAGIVGFAAAITELAETWEDEAGKAKILRDMLETKLKQISPRAVIHGASADRLPNTSCIGFAGFKAETQVMNMDLKGVAISAGAACSSGKVKPSHVLQAMGCNDDLASCSIRVSVGHASCEKDIERFISAWTETMIIQQNKQTDLDKISNA